jgi:hypothetical protein
MMLPVSAVIAHRIGALQERQKSGISRSLSS